MDPANRSADCVLLADAHHALSDGIRRLLATTFGTVVMVADEVSLFESARRLQSDLVVMDLRLPRGDSIAFVRSFRMRFQTTKMIIISDYDIPAVVKATLDAGANGYVMKHALASDLLDAVDAVLTGNAYVSPGICMHADKAAGESARSGP